VPRPSWALTPSPADWRDLVIYQVLTDRFQNGNPANDAIEGGYAPADGARIHGGDFAGLEAKLDYLSHLGVDAIWISPVVVNANAEYHGYAARDLFAIAPHFGTLGELQSLVQSAHARGIYIIVDVVVNHMGDLIDSGNAGYPAWKSPGTYTLRWRNGAKRFYGVLDDLAKFHAHGQIDDFGDQTQVEQGELFGLDDLNTSDSEVRFVLGQAMEWLISNTDCDGFRIDTVKHIEMDFWNAWAPGVHAFAASQGKNSFFLFGEVFDGSDTKCGSYTGTQSGGNYKLDSVLHFPMYFTTNDVFGFDQPPTGITGRYASLDQYDPSSRERLVTFLDNHDNSRFLSFGVANQDESRLRAALGWLLTSRGVPTIYYGTEQEFDGGGDPYNREDMWDGQWDFGPSDGDNFDLVHPLFQYVCALTETRRRHEALRRGSTIQHFVQGGSAGLYLYERRTASDTVLVAINNSNAPIVRAGEATPWPAGTILVDALEPAVLDTTSGGGAMTLRVPARGVRVIESMAAHQAAQSADHLAVRSIFPGHDQALNDRESPITVVFDREVDAHEVATHAHLSPPVSGAWAVESAPGRYVAHFFPDTPWTSEQTYTWSLDATMRALDGHALAARFEARFRTNAYSTGVVLPAEYVADRTARQGLAASEGLIAAPWIAPYTMLLSDTGRDRLYTITPGGDLGHWVGDGRWTKPEGLARMADATAVVDQAGVYSIDGRRLTSAWAGASSASSTGACAYGGGAFGNRLYLSDPTADRIVRLLASGTQQIFATGIQGGEGLAFGPGGDWGTDLYVADANLTSLGTAANGPGRIARITSAGVVSTLVQNASLLGGASAMAFDTGGRFGGSLYVADILGERILQVTAAGAVSVFASGFKNLSGSHCLAFGEDGALYVADAGSGQSFSNSNGTNAPQVIRIARRQLTTEVPPPGRAPLALALPAPNPAREGVTLRFTLPIAEPVRLDVLDLAGRRVRTLIAESRAAGDHVASWNLADDAGRPMPAGLYLVRLRAGLRSVERRVAVIR
jgi:alpha-amylase